MNSHLNTARSLPSSPGERAELSIEKVVERERRYLIGLETLSKFYNLDDLPSHPITQSYFPDKLAESMGRLAAQLGRMEVPAGTVFTQARIRHTHDAFGPHYELLGKGRCPGLEDGERVQVWGNISKEAYESLLKLATAGTVQKTRYIVDGTIADPTLGGDRVIFGEIDVISAAGRPPKAVKNGAGFAFIEVELPRRDLMQTLVEGRHSLNILTESLDLLDAEKRTRWILSNMYIAKHGVDRAVRSQVRKHTA